MIEILEVIDKVYSTTCDECKGKGFLLIGHLATKTDCSCYDGVDMDVLEQNEQLARSIMELLPQWVSVEDGLPEKKKDSLASKVVWIAHKYPSSVGWEYGRGWYNHKLKHWLDSNFNEVDVTHWMSIKPPEAK